MTDTHDTPCRVSGAGTATGELPPVCPRTGLARTGTGCLHCAYSVKVAGWWTCAFKYGGAAMTETDGLRDAVKALFEVTVYLCDVCERNGMSASEGAAISEAYRRYSEAMGGEGNDRDRRAAPPAGRARG